MKIRLITIGKTDEAYLKQGIEKYVARLKHYADFQIIELPDVKMGKKQNVSKQKEPFFNIKISKVTGINKFQVLELL